MDKKRQSRTRRALKMRSKIRELNKVRLCVHRTPRHIYAQVLSADGAQVLASASTLDKQLRANVKNGGNAEAAKVIGEAIAKRASEKGVKEVAFDRSGFNYHGRVKALADAAREHGLAF